jgi:serine/threonine protein phosphatase PrpC
MDSFSIINQQATANNYYHNATVSGSTLTVILTTDENQVFTAAVGDSRAFIYGMDKRSYEDDILHTGTTIDHEPLHQREFKRIKRQGGIVRMNKEEKVERIYIKG